MFNLTWQVIWNTEIIVKSIGISYSNCSYGLETIWPMWPTTVRNAAFSPQFINTHSYSSHTVPSLLHRIRSTALLVAAHVFIVQLRLEHKYFVRIMLSLGGVMKHSHWGSVIPEWCCSFLDCFCCVNGSLKLADISGDYRAAPLCISPDLLGRTTFILINFTGRYRWKPCLFSAFAQHRPK